MVNGRRKYKSDIKYHKVSVKLSDKDFEKLEEDAKAAGVDRSKYIRALVQGAGKVDLKFPLDRANLVRQITGVATNVNQLAKVANGRGDIYFSEIYKCTMLLEEIKTLMKEVLENWRLRKS